MTDDTKTTEGSKSAVHGIVSIADMAKEIHKNAITKGWWEEKRNIPELLCLVHSEVSEALEAYRIHDMKNFAEELADVIIRVFDMAEGLNINIQDEILSKHDKNKKRPYRHGGKAC